MKDPMYIGIWFSLDGGRFILPANMQIEAISMRPPPWLKIEQIEAKGHVTFLIDGREEATIDVRCLPVTPIPAYLSQKKRLRAGSVLSSQLDPPGWLQDWALIVHGRDCRD